MIYDVLVAEQRTVDQALRLCEWFVQQSRVIQLTSDFMTRVHLRPEILKLLSWQISCASFDTCVSNDFRTATYFSGLNSIGDPVVGTNAKQ